MGYSLIINIPHVGEVTIPVTVEELNDIVHDKIAQKILETKIRACIEEYKRKLN